MADDGTNGGGEDDPGGDPYPTEPVKQRTAGTQRWIDELKAITVRELVERIRALEDEFGVSPHAGAGISPAGGNGNGNGDVHASEEKSTFDVVITHAGDKKIQVIKIVRSATSLGLKESKELVDEAPKAVRAGITRDEADKLKAELEGAGATVVLE